MADLTHPDSDWAKLGSLVIERPKKPFARLDRPTVVGIAKEVLRVGKKQAPARKRPRGPMGRPKKRPDLMKAAELRKRGWSWAKIATELGVHRNTLFLKRKELES